MFGFLASELDIKHVVKLYRIVHLRIYTSVLQEYERAVIFRLGRLLSGGARGPGVYSEYKHLDNMFTI